MVARQGIEPCSPAWLASLEGWHIATMLAGHGSCVAPAGSDPASAPFQGAANPSQLESHGVGIAGLEPATSASRTRRPAKLGHIPMVETVGIEPTASTLARRDRSHSCRPHRPAA